MFLLGSGRGRLCKALPSLVLISPRIVYVLSQICKEGIRFTSCRPYQSTFSTNGKLPLTRSRPWHNDLHKVISSSNWCRLLTAIQRKPLYMAFILACKTSSNYMILILTKELNILTKPLATFSSLLPTYEEARGVLLREPRRPEPLQLRPETCHTLIWLHQSPSSNREKVSWSFASTLPSEQPGREWDFLSSLRPSKTSGLITVPGTSQGGNLCVYGVPTWHKYTITSYKIFKGMLSLQSASNLTGAISNIIGTRSIYMCKCITGMPVCQKGKSCTNFYWKALLQYLFLAAFTS